MPAHPVSPTAEPPRLPPLLVVPWPDPVADDLGLDPRGAYVERFWLPLLGPTSTWLLRRFAVEFDASPEGFSLDATDAARSIGIGTRGGRSGPFPRAIDRCVRFGCAQHAEHGILAVRRRLPPAVERAGQPPPPPPARRPRGLAAGPPAQGPRTRPTTPTPPGWPGACSTSGPAPQRSRTSCVAGASTTPAPGGP